MELVDISDLPKYYRGLEVFDSYNGEGSRILGKYSEKDLLNKFVIRDEANNNKHLVVHSITDLEKYQKYNHSLYEKITPEQYIKFFFDIDIEGDNLNKEAIDIEINTLIEATRKILSHDYGVIYYVTANVNKYNSHKYVNGLMVKYSLHVIWQLSFPHWKMCCILKDVADKLQSPHIDTHACHNGLRLFGCSKLSDINRIKRPNTELDTFEKSILSYYPTSHVFVCRKPSPTNVAPKSSQDLPDWIKKKYPHYTCTNVKGNVLSLFGSDKAPCPVCKRRHDSAMVNYITVNRGKYQLRCSRAEGKKFVTL